MQRRTKQYATAAGTISIIATALALIFGGGASSSEPTPDTPKRDGLTLSGSSDQGSIAGASFGSRSARDDSAVTDDINGDASDGSQTCESVIFKLNAQTSLVTGSVDVQGCEPDATVDPEKEVDEATDRVNEVLEEADKAKPEQPSKITIVMAACSDGEQPQLGEPSADYEGEANVDPDLDNGETTVTTPHHPTADPGQHDAGSPPECTAPDAIVE